MQTKVLLTFSLAILILIGNSCTPTLIIHSPYTPTPTFPSPSLTPVIKTLQPLESTATPPLQVGLTPNLTPKYFTEEWQGDHTGWTWFSTHGDDNSWDVYSEAGVLVFYLTGKEIYSYYVYQSQEYEKVRITVKVENRSKTISSTTIVCNYSETLGWYEFNISTNGLWEIRAHDTHGDRGYVLLKSGGSKTIHRGEAINEYSVSCIGNQLTLFANGKKLTEYTDDSMNFAQGKIGIGILSFEQVPVLQEFAWIKIEAP